MNFTLCINTRDDLQPKQHARLLANSLIKAAPNLIMQRIGNYEPISHVVGENLHAEVERFWKYPVLWTRRSPKADGSVWFGNGLNHGAIIVCFSGPPNLVAQADALIRDIASWLNVDLAYIYYSYDEEDDGPKSDGSVYKMSLGVATQDLVRGIPDLAWRTYFGRVYVDLIGRDKLLSCPSHVVSETEGGLVAVALTQSVTAPYDAYEAARKAAKDHLGSDLFWPRNPSESGNARRVPAFEMGPHGSPGFLLATIP